MLNPNYELAALNQTLLTRIIETESGEADLVLRWNKCISLCADTICQLREKVRSNGFSNDEAEISFFKEIKPVAMSRFLYYHELLKLEAGELTGSWKMEKERLEKALQDASVFIQTNQDLLAYIRSGSYHYDRLYFLRGARGWPNCPDLSQFDDLFSTASDERLARLFANELLMRYIDKKLHQVSDQQSGQPASSQPALLSCIASPTAVALLGVALHKSAFFSDGALKVSKNAVMKHLGVCFGIDLSNHSQLVAQAMRGKHPERLFKELNDAFKRYMDELDD
ncbi:RteC domain-containing protein [Paraflavitalea sp. CAU 1676]|uniref:RteC domain-containing protein n=1 Tax=Paraflavitalea sp. CAU 1676 TaxID=3032598 RepID=UPI0023D97C08|nr:RteC domain-containing protein [Paraflavitalea sp. CAU 1676]MDF2191515.1 RteC domain-containing protein [Paraflavitalea sp. CAU 1676]